MTPGNLVLASWVCEQTVFQRMFVLLVCTRFLLHLRGLLVTWKREKKLQSCTYFVPILAQ